jgi:hypothetical protein
MGSLPTLQGVIDLSSQRFLGRKPPITLLSLFLDDYFKVTRKAVKVTTHIYQYIRTKGVLLKSEILMFRFKRVNVKFRLVHEHVIKAYMTGSKTPFIRTLRQYIELNDFLNGLSALTPRNDPRFPLEREQGAPQRLEIQ